MHTTCNSFVVYCLLCFFLYTSIGFHDGIYERLSLQAVTRDKYTAVQPCYVYYNVEVFHIVACGNDLNLRPGRPLCSSVELNLSVLIKSLTHASSNFEVKLTITVCNNHINYKHNLTPLPSPPSPPPPSVLRHYNTDTTLNTSTSWRHCSDRVDFPHNIIFSQK